ncbi:MAG: hypothetical protein K6T83_05245 [Alicyclobacillus sp.]|nr:hypothetical protein [Alicyclobacillus sp.]
MKKFSMYNSGLVPLERYERDIPWIDEIWCDSLRIDTFLGNPHTPFGRTVCGESDRLEFHFDHIDAFCNLACKHDVLPYVSYCYIPLPLQRNNDWRDGPVEWDKWGDALFGLAQHFSTSGFRVGYHEIYNEPDLRGVFYQGEWEDYLRMYEVGAVAVRAADPDAVVGGPASAFVENLNENLDRFLDRVVTRGLPLDFFSLHSYGGNYVERIRLVREALSRHSVLQSTEIHLNECNVEVQPFDTDSPVQDYTMAARILDAIEILLKETDVTYVHWAQFLESGLCTCGLVDTLGRAKAAFRAFQMYSSMPVERVWSECTDMVKTMASLDADRLDVIIWSRSNEPLDIMLECEDFRLHGDVVFSQRVNDTYELSRDGLSKSLPTTVEPILKIGTNVIWNGRLNPFEVVYLQFPRGQLKATKRLEWKREVWARWVRSHYFYPTRGATNYAWFDRRSWTAWLGMGKEVDARSYVGITMEDVPPGVSVIVTPDMVQGNGRTSLLGMRVDFHTARGYTKAILFHGGLYPKTGIHKMPWGTGSSPDQIVHVHGFDRWRLELAEWSPKDWTGRVIVTFMMENTGPGSRVRFVLQPT